MIQNRCHIVSIYSFCSSQPEKSIKQYDIAPFNSCIWIRLTIVKLLLGMLISKVNIELAITRSLITDNRSD